MYLYRQRIEHSFVQTRSMFPVIRSVHLSIAFKANIAHKKWAIIKYIRMYVQQHEKIGYVCTCLNNSYKELQPLTALVDFIYIFNFFRFLSPLQVHDKVNQHSPAALFSALSSLEMLDNKLDFVQILPSDRSTRWCPSAMMVQIVERNPSTGREIYYTIPQANRKFV